MKKHESAFWFVAFLCAALILVGCENPTKGDAGDAGKTIVPVIGSYSSSLFQAAIDASDGIIAGDVTITGSSPIVLPADKTLQLVGTITLPDDGVFVVVSADSLSGDGGFEGTASGSASYLIAPEAVTSARNSGTDLTSVSLQTFGADFDNTASVLGVQGGLAITDTAGAGKIAGKTVYVTGNVTVSSAATPTALNVLGSVNVSAAVTGDVGAQGNVSASALITGAVDAKGKVSFTGATAQNALTRLSAGSVESAVAVTTASGGSINVDGELKTTGATSHVALGGTGTLTAGSLDLAGNLTVGTATTGAVTVDGAATIAGAVTNGAAAAVFTFNGPTTIDTFTSGKAGTVIAGTGAVTVAKALTDTSTNTVIIKNTGGVTLTAANTIAANIVATKATIIGSATGVTIDSDAASILVHSDESIAVAGPGAQIVAGGSNGMGTITGAVLSGGTFTATDAATATLTLGAGAVLAATGTGAVTIGDAGLIVLTDGSSSIILLAGGSLVAPAAGDLIKTGATAAGVKLTVVAASGLATATYATVTDATPFTVTTAAAAGTGSQKVTVGKISWTIDKTDEVDAQAGVAETSGAAGTIKAGAGTALSINAG